MAIIFLQTNLWVTLLFQFISISETVAVNRTKDDNDYRQHFHQTRFKRSKADRWPSNLETWQLNGKQNGIKTSPSTQNTQSVPLTPTAQNIKCSIRGDIKTFTSIITLPSGYTVPPIFEDYIDLDGETSSLTSSQADCSMTLVSSSSSSPKSNIYNMKITDFNKCGVKLEKSADGKEWMSVTLRIPFINGLRTAQDDHVVIVCRPQEAVMAKNSLLDFRTNLQRPVRTVFSSLEPDVEVKVGLFAKPSGVSYYSEEIPFDGLIEVGEELQFRAIVKPGDGWKYAKLTDLKVYMVDDNETDQFLNQQSETKSVKGRKDSAKFDSNKSSVDRDADKLINHKKRNNEAAILVMDNGCRNPVYSALAPYHPYRDTSNPLAVAFNFKAFMFQDMSDDGSIRITAKIMACLEEADCSPSLCLDNGQQGYGRRRRRRSISEDYRNNNNDDDSNSNYHDDQHLSQSIKPGESLITDEDDSSILSDHQEIQNQNVSPFSPNFNEISNFSRNFQVKVVLPGYAKSLQSTSNGDSRNNMDTQSIHLHNVNNYSTCKNSLLLMAASAAILCSATMLAAICTLRATSIKNPAT